MPEGMEPGKNFSGMFIIADQIEKRNGYHEYGLKLQS